MVAICCFTAFSFLFSTVAVGKHRLCHDTVLGFQALIHGLHLFNVLLVLRKRAREKCGVKAGQNHTLQLRRGEVKRVNCPPQFLENKRRSVNFGAPHARLTSSQDPPVMLSSATSNGCRCRWTLKFPYPPSVQQDASMT